MSTTRPRKTLAEMAAATAEAESGGRGPACPQCGCRDTRTKIEARGDSQKRLRVCRHCGRTANGAA